MAAKLDFFSQWLGGDWAERNTINANADALESVEAAIQNLQDTADRQAKEIVQLRATLIGLAEVLQTKLNLDDSTLQRAVTAALETLAPTRAPRIPARDELAAPFDPMSPVATDPYRGMPIDGPTPEDIAAAKKLMRVAEDLHFAKRFDEARSAYQQVVDKYDGTKQAAAARLQLLNLRGVSQNPR